MADNYSARQTLFGIGTPTMPPATDQGGYTGGARKMVEGIDPTVPGNPGYNDYYGLGGTDAVAAQQARYPGANMGGGAIAAPPPAPGMGGGSTGAQPTDGNPYMANTTAQPGSGSRLPPPGMGGGGYTTNASGDAPPPVQTGGADPASGYRRGTQQQNGGFNMFNLSSMPTTANGAPDYFKLAQQQSQYNQQNAQQQNQMNNPNYNGPAGSQTRTQNPDGTWTVNQSLNPELNQAYSQQNQLKSQLLGQASQAASNGPLNYNNVSPSAKYDTSGVSAIPGTDANNLAQMRDSVYSQQTQYLDPQFKQQQGDLENKLANQGIMPGSEAYKREMDNFAQTKQKAYGDARNSAIQAGGNEQSRLFGIGLQAHTTGTNDALSNFQTGMQGRQQGVSEANALHNAPINDINALNGVTNTVQLPNYPGQTGTSVPGVDIMNAGNLQNNANLGISNANAARSQGNINGLYGLGSAFLQSGPGQNLLNSMFGGDTNAYNNWISQNTQVLTDNPGMTPEDLASAAMQN